MGPKQYGARAGRQVIYPVPGNSDEAELLRLWSTSPDTNEAELMAVLPLWQADPRMQRLAQEAIERRRNVR